MLYGAGSIMLLSKELSLDAAIGGNIMFPGLVASFGLTFQDQNAEAKALVAGKRQIVAAAITESIATLQLNFEYQDWQTLQFAFDELAGTTSSVDLPALYTGTADSSGLVNFPTNSIPTNAVLGKDLFFYVASRGPWGDRGFVALDTANGADEPYNTNEGSFINVAESITKGATSAVKLPAIYAGAVVQMTANKTHSSIETIGVEAEYSSWGKLIFSGVLNGTEFDGRGAQIIVPEISRIATPQITVNGSLTEMQIQFRASVPAGKRRPFEIYNISQSA